MHTPIHQDIAALSSLEGLSQAQIDHTFVRILKHARQDELLSSGRLTEEQVQGMYALYRLIWAVRRPTARAAMNPELRALVDTTIESRIPMWPRLYMMFDSARYQPY